MREHASPEKWLFHHERRRPRGMLRTAIVILCHDYGRFLTEAVESALAQTWPAREVLIVDDASTDDTDSVAAGFRDRGVRYLRVEHRHPLRAKRAGYEHTAGEAVVWLDADDRLPPDYLEHGLPLFADHRVGIVYSDLQEFGDRDHVVRFGDFDPLALAQRNYIHSGAIVSRHALLSSQALEEPVGEPSHHDWRVWRRVVGAGFRAEKQPALYEHRRHPGQLSQSGSALSYFDRAALSQETVTIFVPLSGRGSAWESHLRPWLDGQTWPRDQVRLVLADTSQDDGFGRTVRSWALGSDYHDVRVYRQTVGQRGLNGFPRPNDGGAEVNLAMRRIYGRLARDLTTDYVLVVEDDHRPPHDAVERLLRGMDEKTAAVSGLYRGRSPAGEYVAWSDREPSAVRPEHGPAIPISGSGFGTLLLRRSWLDGETFLYRCGDPFPYDIRFCHRVGKRGGVWKLARDVLSEHAGAPLLPPLPDSGPTNPEPVPSGEAAALRVVASCPSARLCGCADRSKIQRPAGVHGKPHDPPAS